MAGITLEGMLNSNKEILLNQIINTKIELVYKNNKIEKMSIPSCSFDDKKYISNYLLKKPIKIRDIKSIIINGEEILINP